MSLEKLRQELRREVNEEIRVVLGMAFTNAYRYFNRLIINEAFLNGHTGVEVRPHVRKAEVDRHLKTLDSAGLGITWKEVPNESHNSWHIELRIGRFVLTHNFVHDQEEHPRDCVFRNNLRLKNLQLSLFDEKNNPIRAVQETDDIVNAIIYGQIIHGGDSFLDFLMLCIPNHDATEWIDKLRLPIVAKEVPTEYIPPTDQPPLKESKKQKEDL